MTALLAPSRIEQVHTGQRVRRPGHTAYRTVSGHGPGLCHGIRLEFTDGSSLTALPDTPMEVLA